MSRAHKISMENFGFIFAMLKYCINIPIESEIKANYLAKEVISMRFLI